MCFKPVEVGVGGVVTFIVKLDFNACFFQGQLVARKAGVIGCPTEESPVESKVAPLILMGGDEGAVGIVSHDELLNGLSGERFYNSANPVGGGAMRATRAAHDGAKDIVKNAGRRFHRLVEGSLLYIEAGGQAGVCLL